MWKLSEPGGEAEGCFLRVPQTDFFYDGRDVHLDWMPDASFLCWLHTNQADILANLRTVA